MHRKNTDEIGSIPRGLWNVGNTCYFNSVIQPLCHTHALYSELWKAGQDGDLALSYMTVYHSMRNEATTKPFAPNEVRNQFVTRVSRFNNRRQHDSHECLRHFLDEIRKEERLTSDSLLTVVDKIFGGHLVTVYICQECDKHHHLFEPCLDISLPVFFEAEKNSKNEALGCKSNDKTGQSRQHVNFGRDDDNKVAAKDGGLCTDEHHKHREANQNNSENENRGRESNDYKTTISKLTQRLSFTPSVHFPSPLIHTSTNSLNDCLAHFSRVEQINEEYLCEDCLREAMARGEADEDNLKLTSATKQTLIFNPPAILTIHFKRFELLPGRSRKRPDLVKYPEYLDIAPYCSSQCLRNDPPRNNIWYSLYAVIVHSGSLNSGHYKAYVKMREKYENIEVLNTFLQQEYFNHNVTSDELIKMLTMTRTQEKMDEKSSKRDESKWYLINDSSVRRVSIDSVLKQEAYLLFYERIKVNESLAKMKRGLNNATISEDCQKDNWFVRAWKYIGLSRSSIEEAIKQNHISFGQMSIPI